MSGVGYIRLTYNDLDRSSAVKNGVWKLKRLFVLKLQSARVWSQIASDIHKGERLKRMKRDGEVFWAGTTVGQQPHRIGKGKKG